jgi:hypothetical protein
MNDYSGTLLERKLNEAVLLSLQDNRHRIADADQARTEAKLCRDKAAQYLEQAQAEERVE